MIQSSRAIRCSCHIAFLFARNDPLDAVWRESETALDFSRKVEYAEAADIVISQQRFMATMQGRTATFSTFSDAQFDEATFEAQLSEGRTPMMICWYWILKLEARFLSGNYAEALAAAGNAKRLLETAASQIQQFSYFYYTALTVSALYESASTDEQEAWRELLKAHLEQLREWAENNPPTFGDKYTLILAEIARLEKRDADALRLYEEAIHSAREHELRSKRGVGPRTGGAVLSGASSRYGWVRSSRICAELLRPLGRLRQSKAARRTLSAPARGTESHRFGHDWPANRATRRRDCGQSFAGTFG